MGGGIAFENPQFQTEPFLFRIHNWRKTEGGPTIGTNLFQIKCRYRGPHRPQQSAQNQ